jgi:MFS family permease
MSGDDRQLIDRAVWRVMPLAALCFVAAVIDKANIGFAKLQMTKSLGLSETAFGFGASLFFLAFIVFEVPSALIAHRIGARLWVARIMATWGVITVLMAFSRSEIGFYVLRFLLGAAEAGLYPTLLFYLTLWFPQSAQTRVAAFLTLGSAIGNGTGALISGALLDLNGVLGFEGWQWIFLVTGALPVLMTVLVLRGMADTPAQARFLSPDERDRLTEAVARDRPPAADETRTFAALADARVLGWSVIYALLGVALFGTVYWTPTAIKAFGVGGTVNGLLTGAPWVVTAIMLLTLPARLKTNVAVARAMTVIGIAGAVCFAIVALSPPPVLSYAALFFGTPCISVLIALFWTFPVRLFPGAQAAAVIAGINVMGNVGGFIAQNLMPAAAHAGGTAAFAMWVPAVSLLLIALFLPRTSRG